MQFNSDRGILIPISRGGDPDGADKLSGSGLADTQDSFLSSYEAPSRPKKVRHNDRMDDAIFSKKIGIDTSILTIFKRFFATYTVKIACHFNNTC